MSCKPFSDPLRNALSYLHTQGAIDANRQIINPRKFDLYNSRLQRQTMEDYGITQPLFSREGSQIIPNYEVFLSLGQDLGTPSEELVDEEVFELEDSIITEPIPYQPYDVQESIAKSNPAIESKEDLEGVDFLTEEEFVAVQDAVKNGLIKVECS